jgi:GT2 family glycosyltransferase
LSVADPTASIIVPSFNRCSRLERLLRRLDRAAPGAPFEVVVAVDGSTDGTRQMLGSLQVRYPLQILFGDNRGPAAARNRAMQAAGGDVVVFLDDDVEPVDGLIERHLEIHRRDPAAAVIGPMVPPTDTTLPPWLRWDAAILQRQYEMLASGFAGPTPLHFYTANASVRRAHALAVGGFDERYRRMEDMELAYRLAAHGVRFVFLPEARVMHEPDRTLAGWLRIADQSGRHAQRLERAHHAYARALAYQESRRHPWNRLPPRWAVGHGSRVRAIMTTGGALLRYRGPHQDRVHRAACSVMYNVQFWQGFADETGTGRLVWAELVTQRRAQAEVA